MTPENISSIPVSSRIIDLFSSLDKPQLQPSEINIAFLKNQLEKGSFNLTQTPEIINSLKETKFKNYKSGRGPAMSRILGDKVEAFEELIKTECRDYFRNLKGDKTRGARQLAADLVSVTLGAIDPEEFCNRTNRRRQKSFDKNCKDLIAGLPPQAVVEVIKFFIAQ